MYCVKCGSEEKTYGKLCRKCLVEEKDLVRIPPHLARVVCPECGDYRIGSQMWVGPLEGMQAVIQNNLEFYEQVSDPSIDYEEFPTGTNEFQIHLTVEVNIDDSFIEVPLTFQLRTKHQVCDICSRQRGGYYEAIIQIRGDGREPSEDDLDGIAKHIGKALESNTSDRLAFLTKEAKVKGGHDFFMGSSKLSKSLIRELQSRYGGRVTETSSIFGQKDGKDVYRHTYLLRLPKLRRGDVVSDPKNIYQVTEVNKNFAFMKDLRTWKKRKVKYDDFDRFNVNMGGYTVSEAVIVSEGDDEIQLMHPRSYKTIVLRKPDDFCSDGQEASVIIIEDDLFLV